MSLINRREGIFIKEKSVFRGMLWLLLCVAFLMILWVLFTWISPKSLLSLYHNIPEHNVEQTAMILISTAGGEVRQADVTDAGQMAALIDRMDTIQINEAGRYQSISIPSVLYRVYLFSNSGGEITEHGDLALNPEGEVFAEGGKKYQIQGEEADILIEELFQLSKNAQPVGESARE